MSTATLISFVLLDLLLILAAARILGWLARRLGQPRVVGEIVAGILLGPTLLGPTLAGWPTPWGVLPCATAADPSVTVCLFPSEAVVVLEVIGQLGLALFMFLVGMRIDLGFLRPRLKRAFSIGASAVAIPLLLGLLSSVALYEPRFVPGFDDPALRPGWLGFGLMVGAIMAVTAFPVMVRILQEKALADSELGALGTGSAAIVTVLMFMAVGMATAIGSTTDLAGLIGRAGLSALYVVGMIAAAGPLADRLRAASMTSPAFLTAGLSLLLSSSLLAHALGLSVIVGGFLAGIAMPRDPRADRLHDSLFDLTTVLLLPVFLAFSGLNTDFTTLSLGALPGIGLFLAVGVVAKWGGTLVTSRWVGLSLAEANVLGILMNCRGLLVLVAALVGLQRGLISPELQVGAVLMALVTTMMTGPLLDRALVAVETASTIPRPD